MELYILYNKIEELLSDRGNQGIQSCSEIIYIAGDDGCYICTMKLDDELKTLLDLEKQTPWVSKYSDNK